MRAALPSIVVLVTLQATGRPTPAVEDDVAGEQARLHYVEGRERFARGEDEAAIAEFRIAYAVRPDPALLFDIGQCQRRLGQRAAALASYRAYLQSENDAGRRAEVLRLIETIERDERLTAARAPTAPTRAPARPLHRRWWLWTAVGGTAVAALAIGLGVALSSSAPTANTTVPAIRF